METKMEKRVKTPANDPANDPAALGGALSQFDERVVAGEFSPYLERLALIDRAGSFMKVCQARGIRYAVCTLENFEVTNGEQQQALNVVRNFCEEMPDRIRLGGGLVLLGPPGTGKDHLLMAAMRVAIIQHGYTVAWHDGLRLYQRIKSAIADNLTEDFLKAMFKPQILALSDPVPPRDELTAYELSILRNVVEHRYSHGMSTWVTTNVDNKAQAQRLFSGAVLDRLLHGATEVFCNWASYRKPAV